MKCLYCENEAVWVRKTQFSSDPPLCDNCAHNEADFGKEDSYKFWKQVKGHHGCRCDCCVYWRRHVHRVAGNRDRNTRKEEKEKEYYQHKMRVAQRDLKDAQSVSYEKTKALHSLRTQLRVYEKENRELRENLESIPFHIWLGNKIRKVAKFVEPD